MYFVDWVHFFHINLVVVVVVAAAAAAAAAAALLLLLLAGCNVATVATAHRRAPHVASESRLRDLSISLYYVV